MKALPGSGFDFDAVVERTGTDSLKWAKFAGREEAGGIIPLWVADMDFASPPAVLRAMHRRIDHGVFGYNVPTAEQSEAVTGYLARHFGWEIESEWIVWLPGLVTGINVACRATGGTGDAVFTATPVYPPFLSAPHHAGRRLATVPLVRDSGGWLWDFPACDAALKGSSARLFLLCHPHNPTGRAWSEDELWQVALLAEKYDLIVCSDEIHSGLVLAPGVRHKPLATLGPEIAARTITLMAPSKTFNIPGLGCAFAIIPSASLRRSFRAAMQGIVPHVNALGMVACDAALRDCDDWQEALLTYLRSNARAVERAVGEARGLDMRPIEATYLAWIDAREYAAAHGTTDPVPLFEAHGLGLSDGAEFGAPGFVRLNFGTRRTLLDEALARLTQATAG